MNLAIEKLPRFCNRAMASFIVDDFAPLAPQDTAGFARFSQSVRQTGAKGECSVILGMRRDEQGRAFPLDAGFPAESARAATHIDHYMEVMTHHSLYDFAADRIKTSGPHEGVWLLDRTVAMEEYLEYFRQIALRGQAHGLRYAGVTLPGCGCEPCTEFYRRQHLPWQAPVFVLNPGVHQALLTLAAEGLLAGPMCGIFAGNYPSGPADVCLIAEREGLAVYDLPPGVAGDFMGRWDQNPEFLNADAYLTADGQGGRLEQLLAQETRTLIFYGHWQSLQPGRIGFAVFQEVIQRLSQYYAQRIIWMRPTEIMAYRHTERHTELRVSADGRSFTLKIPFVPPHLLTLRVLGGGQISLRSPGGAVLQPSQPTVGGALFNLIPENGRYEVLSR